MKNLLTALILLFAMAAGAQTQITGKVTDRKGVSVPGANVYIKGTYDGTSSDAEGNFLFSTNEKGKQVLTIQSIGFKVVENEIDCSGQPVVMNTSLSESINLLTAVTITAGAMEASDKSKAVVLKPWIL